MTGTIDLAPDGKNLEIRFPYRPDLVEEVKTISGRRWDRNGKLWRVPAEQVKHAYSVFMRHGFTMSSEVSGLLAGVQGVPADPVETEEKEPPVDSETGTQGALSISGLNERVRAAIQGGFPEPIWVVGEVTDYDKNQDRQHIFFTLLEKTGEAISAQVSVAMFERTAKSLRSKLSRLADPMNLADGIEIRALVRVDLYPRNGRYQLIVEDIDPSFTLGKLALGREEILRELRDKKLDAKNSSLLLPVPTLRVGVLTSVNSDGWNDFHKQIQASDIGFSITVYDARVQGELLRPTILKGLKYFAERKTEFDVVCIVRGGGSRTDLAWFDDRDVALAVARHPLKIICGIGHQRDQSILDLISHSEKTPTAVANYLATEVRRHDEVLSDLSRSLVQVVQKLLANEGHQIAGAAHRLQHRVQGMLMAEKERMATVGKRLGRSVKLRIRNERDRLIRSSQALVGSVRMHIVHEKTFRQQARNRLRASSRTTLDRALALHETRSARQRLLDPTLVMRRGYTMARTAKGEILTSVAGLTEGDRLDIQFRDGLANTLVQDISPKTP